MKFDTEIRVGDLVHIDGNCIIATVVEVYHHENGIVFRMDNGLSYPAGMIHMPLSVVQLLERFPVAFAEWHDWLQDADIEFTAKTCSFWYGHDGLNLRTGGPGGIFLWDGKHWG